MNDDAWAHAFAAIGVAFAFGFLLHGWPSLITHNHYHAKDDDEESDE